MRVTIITPTFNRAEFLDETVLSLLQQDYNPLEIVVLDDGSTDQTAAVLARYAERIRIESHSNMGEAKTVNKGIGITSGDAICVVNSDDPLRPGAIKALVEALNENPDAILAYPDWEEIDETGMVLRTVEVTQLDIHNMLRKFNIAMGPGVIFRRSLIASIGLRREDRRFGSDVDFWIRAAMVGPFAYVRQPLATHRVHANAASSSQRGAQMASEVANFVHDALANPLIPKSLKRDRRALLANAHLVALNYCGDDKRAIELHMQKALHYSRLKYFFWLNSSAFLWTKYLLGYPFRVVKIVVRRRYLFSSRFSRLHLMESYVKYVIGYPFRAAIIIFRRRYLFRRRDSSAGVDPKA